jgi:hypothetical protein
MRFNIKYGMIGAIVGYSIFRTILGIHGQTTKINVSENDFCKYLSPRKINFFFFDYYEYFVEWKTIPHPPAYQYWSITTKHIEFTQDKNCYNRAKIF